MEQDAKHRSFVIRQLSILLGPCESKHLVIDAPIKDDYILDHDPFETPSRWLDRDSATPKQNAEALQSWITAIASKNHRLESLNFRAHWSAFESEGSMAEMRQVFSSLTGCRMMLSLELFTHENRTGWRLATMILEYRAACARLWSLLEAAEGMQILKLGSYGYAGYQGSPWRHCVDATAIFEHGQRWKHLTSLTLQRFVINEETFCKDTAAASNFSHRARLGPWDDVRRLLAFGLQKDSW